jgi:hypothetical protein
MAQSLPRPPPPRPRWATGVAATTAAMATMRTDFILKECCFGKKEWIVLEKCFLDAYFSGTRNTIALYTELLPQLTSQQMQPLEITHDSFTIIASTVRVVTSLLKWARTTKARYRWAEMSAVFSLGIIICGSCYVGKLLILKLRFSPRKSQNSCIPNQFEVI